MPTKTYGANIMSLHLYALTYHNHLFDISQSSVWNIVNFYKEYFIVKLLQYSLLSDFVYFAINPILQYLYEFVFYHQHPCDYC